MAALSSMFVASVLPKFASSVDTEKYKCCKCHNMLRPPVRQTVCGHRLCSLCLDEHLRSKNTMCPGQGLDDDACADLMEAGTVTPDFGTERDLRKLAVLCDYEPFGCRDTPAWSKLARHVEECSFKPKLCPNASNGCAFKGAGAMVDKHVPHCDFAPKECPYCYETMPSNMLKGHMEECVTTPKKCPMHYVGCDFKGNVEEVQGHTDDKGVMSRHIAMLGRRVRTLEESETHMRSVLTEHESEIKLSASRSATAGAAAAMIPPPAEGNKIHQTLMKNYAKTSERVSKVETRVEGQVEFMSGQSDKMTSLQDVSKMHESRLSQLEQTTRGGGGGGTARYIYDTEAETWCDCQPALDSFGRCPRDQTGGRRAREVSEGGRPLDTPTSSPGKHWKATRS